MPSTFVNMWKGTPGWIEVHKCHWNFPHLTFDLPKNPSCSRNQVGEQFNPCEEKPEADWLLRRTFGKLPFPKRWAELHVITYLCAALLVGSWLQACRREKKKKSVWFRKPLYLPWGRSIVLPHVCGCALPGPARTLCIPAPLSHCPLEESQRGGLLFLLT